WTLLLALVAVVAALEYRDLATSRMGTAARDPGLLVPVAVGDLGAVEIADGGLLHRFERDAAGGWFYHGVHAGNEGTRSHGADPAAGRRIEETVAAFARARVERRVAPGHDPKTYGLTPPQMVVLLYRADAREPLAQFAVGDVAPDTVSRYVE